MKTNRKEFLKNAGLAGIGIAFAKFSGENQSGSKTAFKQNYRQRFNMHGYAAPKLETVRVGLIGIGSRGSAALRRLIHIEGVKITALADLDPDAVDRGSEIIGNNSTNPATYSGGEDEWKKLCERADVDVVYICTPWELHTPQSIYAMENEKHACSELPCAMTIDDCWQLVETSEKTRKHLIILGNQCFGSFELLTLNMARKGFFGDLIHGDGAYMNDLSSYKFNKNKTWYLERDIDRLGALYNIHGIGPIAQKMEINCGDSMDYFASMTGDDFTMGEKVKEMAEQDSHWEPFIGKNFNGNMTTCIVRTKRGRTMMFQYDHYSPRPSTKIHLISGTEGMAMMDPPPKRFYTSKLDRWLSDDEYKSVVEKYTPEITKRVGSMAEAVGGTTDYYHGGQDTVMDWRWVDCLRNGLPVEQNVYDAATWSSLIELSEYSSSNRAMIDVPDFTGGSWKTNKPLMDLDLKTGGTTKLI